MAKPKRFTGLTPEDQAGGQTKGRSQQPQRAAKAAGLGDLQIKVEILERKVAALRSDMRRMVGIVARQDRRTRQAKSEQYFKGQSGQA